MFALSMEKPEESPAFGLNRWVCPVLFLSPSSLQGPQTQQTHQQDLVSLAVASAIIQWCEACRQDLNMKQAPWGTLTNDQGLSVCGWQPMTASWAILPDPCDSPRLMKHFRTGVNEL